MNEQVLIEANNKFWDGPDENKIIKRIFILCSICVFIYLVISCSLNTEMAIWKKGMLVIIATPLIGWFLTMGLVFLYCFLVLLPCTLLLAHERITVTSNRIYGIGIYGASLKKEFDCPIEAIIAVYPGSLRGITILTVYGKIRFKLMEGRDEVCIAIGNLVLEQRKNMGLRNKADYADYLDALAEDEPTETIEEESFTHEDDLQLPF